jgi:hypothetical protein
MQCLHHTVSELASSIDEELIQAKQLMGKCTIIHQQAITVQQLEQQVYAITL